MKKALVLFTFLLSCIIILNSKVSTNSTSKHIELAEYYLHINEYNAAISEFEKILEIDSDNIKAKEGLKQTNLLMFNLKNQIIELSKNNDNELLDYGDYIVETSTIQNLKGITSLGLADKKVSGISPLGLADKKVSGIYSNK